MYQIKNVSFSFYIIS